MDSPELTSAPDGSWQLVGAEGEVLWSGGRPPSTPVWAPNRRVFAHREGAVLLLRNGRTGDLLAEARPQGPPLVHDTPFGRYLALGEEDQIWLWDERPAPREGLPAWLSERMTLGGAFAALEGLQHEVRLIQFPELLELEREVPWERLPGLSIERLHFRFSPGAQWLAVFMEVSWRNRLDQQVVQDDSRVFLWELPGLLPLRVLVPDALQGVFEVRWPEDGILEVQSCPSRVRVQEGEAEEEDRECAVTVSRWDAATGKRLS